MKTLTPCDHDECPPTRCTRTASDEAVVCKELLACPWCDSEKIMAEGTDKRMAMVCQKCLARGPEVNVTEGRDAAIREWNKAMRQPHQKARYECERCGMTVALVYYGWLKVHKWKHVGGKSRPKRICCGLPPKVKVRQANNALSKSHEIEPQKLPKLDA